jgi:hypothetical protein
MKAKLKEIRAAIKALSIKADLSDEESKQLEKLMADEAKVSRQIEAQEIAAKAEAEEKAEQEKVLAAKAQEIADAKIAEYKAEAAKARRLPFEQSAYQTQFAETGKYDNLTPGELGLAINLMQSSGRVAVQQSALKALAIKLIEDKTDYGDRHLSPEYSHGAMKAAGLTLNKDDYKDGAKAATDPMYTGGTTDGGNWVHTAFGRDLWGTLRAQATIVSKIPSQVIPDGYKSATIPLEGTDFTWYSAPETTATDSTTKQPLPTIDGSQITTPTNKEITVGKMGARGWYTGELTEDSIISFAPQARLQLITSGKEQLEHAVIDGDTATAGTTNINHIGGTPTSTGTARDLFLLFDGFRKLALVTNTANSRAGGSLDEDDFLETMWLMGTAGLAGAELDKCSFIIDPNVYKQSLKMATVKTKDVWTNATVETGVLTKLWGYNILASWFMHFKSTVRKANSAGKVDQTTVANNAYGSLLGVRWDQWKFAYKRVMSIEVTRFANSDSWEIVSWARVGLGYRDNEASAISYGLTI